MFLERFSRSERLTKSSFLLNFTNKIEQKCHISIRISQEETTGITIPVEEPVTLIYLQIRMRESIFLLHIRETYSEIK
jgi:hypothetical protein